MAKFPVKFPDTRDFAWRRVRSALRRQPASPALRETVPNSRRNARQQRAFLIHRPVSSIPISPTAGRNCQKSLATCRNIPIFGRRRPETGFDPHCMAETIWTKLHAPHAVIEPVSEPRARNGIFCCRDGSAKPAVPPLRDRYRDAQRFEKAPFWRD
jgi:hypothetical protein